MISLSPGKRNRRSHILLCVFLLIGITPILLAPRSAAAQIIINEFMAAGNRTLLDEDGDTPDWIELANVSGESQDLAGWSLTDDATSPGKWLFPSVQIPAQSFLVLFASGKDRTGTVLHTNFALNGDGEFLGLYAPGNPEPVSAFSPSYPKQIDGYSFGVGLDDSSGRLVAAHAPARYRVPMDDTTPEGWRGGDATFDDSPTAGWTEGFLGLGYDQSAPTAGIAPSPLGYWPFDGDAQDASGNDHTGAIRGPVFVNESPLAVDSPQALSFNGSTQYVSVAIDVSETDYALSLWFKAAADNCGIYSAVISDLGASHDRHIYLSNGQLKSRVWQEEVIATSGQNYADGQWHHVVHTFGGAVGGQRLYVDGQLVAQGLKEYSDFTGQEYINIGYSRDAVDDFFRGVIDEVAVFSSALTEEQVQALYQGASPLALSGFGSLIGTDMGTAMKNNSSSVFARMAFEIDDPTQFDQLTLSIFYDDGFVAWINGTQVAARNAPIVLDATSLATTDRDRFLAVQAERIDLTSGLGALRAGVNTLAIQGLNDSIASDDFLLAPMLSASRSTPAMYLSPPTPGQTNQGGFLGAVADTTFTVRRGFYDAPFEVAIGTSTEGAEILYTLDGTEPGPDNPLSQVYSGPIRIETTTNLRAMAQKSQYIPTNCDAQTYIFIDDVANQPNLPEGLTPTWLNDFPADYGVDREVVDSALPGYGFREALLSLPTISVSMNMDDLFAADGGIYYNSIRSGPKDVKPCSVEWIEPDGGKGFQLGAGIRTHGFSSRDHTFTPKHSFRLKFQSVYGPPKLKERLFPDTRVDTFDELVLRGCSTDSFPVKDGGAGRDGVPRWSRFQAQYLRDQWMRDSMLDMGHEAAHARYVHLFLNGLYWGMYNLAERHSDSYFSEHFGGQREDWDIVHDENLLDSGDKVAWNAMHSLAAAGLETTEAYYRIQGLNPDGSRNPDYPVYLDVANLIDYMILHIYAGVEDWPHHNWWAGRRRGPESEGFRFYVWDQEISLNTLLRTKTLSNVHLELWESEEGMITMGPAYLYGRLRKNTEFRRRFTDRIHALLFNEGLLTADVSHGRYLRRVAEIDQAIVGESARWGDAKETPAMKREVEWMNQIEWLRAVYWPQEHDVAIGRFRNVGLYPNLAAPVFTVNGAQQHGGLVTPATTIGFGTTPATIYYTVDGSDPRPIEEPTIDESILIHAEAPKRILIPSATNGGDAMGLTWTNPSGFDDSAWSEAKGGIGYERSAGYESYFTFNTGAAMVDITESCYARVPFSLTQDAITSLSALILQVRYDDGFVAYLNGARVAEANAPATPVWNSGATTSHDDGLAITWVDFDITDHRDLLVAGENLLAIHGLNYRVTSSDFLINVQLKSRRASDSGPALTTAQRYDSPFVLEQNTQIRAASWDGIEWSALTAALFTVSPEPTVPIVTELMFAPTSLDGFEYIELHHPGTVNAMALGGFTFSDGIDFTFPIDAVLPPGGYALVVPDASPDFADFRTQYGLSAETLIFGPFSGKLSNEGERVTLRRSLAGETILSFEYNDGRGWPLSACGAGHSMVPILGWPRSDKALDYGGHWRASARIKGSPGQADPAPTSNLILNEIMVHTDYFTPPWDSNDWIEVLNTSPHPVDWANWYLSDDAADLKKWAIPAGALSVGGRMVFDEVTGFHNPITSGFGLNKNGEQVFLSWLPGNGLDRVADAVRFNGEESGWSLSRVPDGSPWWRHSLSTRNTVNAPPWPDLVIDEVMYHPAVSETSLTDDSVLEYIEIWNPTNRVISLTTEAGPWRLNGAVEYLFDPSLVLLPGDRIVVVGFAADTVDPMNAFRAFYGASLPADATIVGPWTGVLSNAGERLALERPQAPDVIGDPVSWVIVDELLYFDQIPFDARCDGQGFSLQRAGTVLAGRDPVNWPAGIPTPGAAKRLTARRPVSGWWIY